MAGWHKHDLCTTRHTSLGLTLTPLAPGCLPSAEITEYTVYLFYKAADDDGELIRANGYTSMGEELGDGKASGQCCQACMLRFAC